jgi:hypothetical protein
MFLFVSSSFAKFDAATGFQARTQPMVGGEVYGELGWNQLLWGKEDSLFRGFLRPNILGATSVVVNSIKSELEFYPVSFLGFSYAYQKVQSDFNFPFFDCEEIYCKGRQERRYFETRLALGYKGWILLTFWREDHVQYDQHNKPFGDFRKVIVGNAGHDLAHEVKMVFGKILAPKKMIGIAAETAKFELSGQISETYFGVYQFPYKDSTIAIGAGSFRSSEQGMGPVVYFRMNTQLFSSVKLF